ncbi:hypothetical protein TNIN_28351 [Trichonephila inaurata madagascariensis]|uniref:DUF382 domain-containing protein n=1 Tax=Trichonephila inaurata madagascariensis TaxID=2747483 RepID=A0A8X6Y9U4_9ARAC|nr:hypothetical protein TNIN_28351 [Trichonephila inaurata madagascariensis]
MDCVEEQMRHVQEHKGRIKAEQKRFQEERCKRIDKQNQLLSEEQEKLSDEDMKVLQAIEKVLVFKSERAQMLSVYPDAVAQPVAVEEEKGLSGDSSNVPLISAEDEIEEPKLLKKKLKKLSRMTVAELQQKVNLKASSNIIVVPHHWCFKRKYSQDKLGIGEPAWKLSDFIKRVGITKK